MLTKPIKFADCNHCTLFNRPLVFGAFSGNGKPLLVGEAPGFDEVLAGIPFIGRAGELLNELLFLYGLDRRELNITNACICHPVTEDEKQNRPPTFAEMDCCSGRLLESIQRIKPPITIALGKSAYYALTGEKIDKLALVAGVKTKTRNGFKLIATYHPAAALRSNSYRIPLERDLKELSHAAAEA